MFTKLKVLLINVFLLLFLNHSLQAETIYKIYEITEIKQDNLQNALKSIPIFGEMISISDINKEVLVIKSENNKTTVKFNQLTKIYDANIMNFEIIIKNVKFVFDANKRTVIKSFTDNENNQNVEYKLVEIFNTKKYFENFTDKKQVKNLEKIIEDQKNENENLLKKIKAQNMIISSNLTKKNTPADNLNKNSEKENLTEQIKSLSKALKDIKQKYLILETKYDALIDTSKQNNDNIINNNVKLEEVKQQLKDAQLKIKTLKETITQKDKRTD